MQDFLADTKEWPIYMNLCNDLLDRNLHRNLPSFWRIGTHISKRRFSSNKADRLLLFSNHYDISKHKGSFMLIELYFPAAALRASI